MSRWVKKTVSVMSDHGPGRVLPRMVESYITDEYTTHKYQSEADFWELTSSLDGPCCRCLLENLENGNGWAGSQFSFQRLHEACGDECDIPNNYQLIKKIEDCFDKVWEAANERGLDMESIRGSLRGVQEEWADLGKFQYSREEQTRGGRKK